jgi:hypothetical protein
MEKTGGEPPMKRLFFAVLCTLVLAACGNEESAKPAEPKAEKTEEKATEKPVEQSKPSESTEPAKNESSASVESTESTETSESTEESSSIVMAGENGVLADDVIIALGEDKTNLDELMNYITAKNTEAVNRMILEGKAVIHEKGTPVTVVDSSFAALKIEVIETGERGWVPYEFVTKK